MTCSTCGGQIAEALDRCWWCGARGAIAQAQGSKVAGVPPDHFAEERRGLVRYVALLLRGLTGLHHSTCGRIARELDRRGVLVDV